MNIRKSLPAGFPSSGTFMFSNLYKSYYHYATPFNFFSYLNMMINLNKASQQIGNTPSKTNKEYIIEI